MVAGSMIRDTVSLADEQGLVAAAALAQGYHQDKSGLKFAEVHVDVHRGRPNNNR